MTRLGAALLWLAAGAACQPAPPAEPVAPRAPDARAVVAVHVIDTAGAGLAGVSVSDETTDATGACEVRIPAGAARTIGVARPGYCPAAVEVEALDAGARVERWVRLERGRALDVTVVVEGSGEPAAGARVELESWLGPVDPVSPRVGTADDHGHVRFEGVPDGFVGLRVVPRGYGSPQHRLQLLAGRDVGPIRLAARPCTHLVLDIVDPEGAPVKDARALASQLGGRARVVVSVDGRIEDDVPRGDPCRFHVLDASWRWGIVDFVSDGRPSRHERVVVRPAREHPDRREFRLLVTDEDTKEPVPGVHVNLEFHDRVLGLVSTDELGIPGMETDASGRLVIPDLPWRPTVRLEKDGYDRSAGLSLADRDGAIEGTLSIGRTQASDSVTCRPSRPVELQVRGGYPDETGLFEVSSYGAEHVDIHYEPLTAISRELLLAGVPAGARDVVLPLYDTGEVLVRCRDASGHPVPRAWIFAEGASGSGSDRLEDARGRMLVEDVPVGTYQVWVWAPGRAEVGPYPCEVVAGGRAEIEATFGEPLAIVAVRVGRVDGSAFEECHVHLLNRQRTASAPILGKRLHELLGPWPFDTGIDGRCYVEALSGRFVVALSSVLDYDQKPWSGPWSHKWFGFQDVTVPTSGIVDVSIVLDWAVFVTRLETGAPGDKAGFRPGDRIVSWAGKPVRTVEDCAASGPAVVKVRRGAETLDLTLPPGGHGVVLDARYVER